MTGDGFPLRFCVSSSSKMGSIPAISPSPKSRLLPGIFKGAKDWLSPSKEVKEGDWLGGGVRGFLPFGICWPCG